MPSATMTSKGQFTMPVEIRRKLGLKAGSRLEFEEQKNGDYILKPKKRSIMELSGAGKWEGPPLSIENMNVIIAKGWAGLLDDSEVEK